MYIKSCNANAAVFYSECEIGWLFCVIGSLLQRVICNKLKSILQLLSEQVTGTGGLNYIGIDPWIIHDTSFILITVIHLIWKLKPHTALNEFGFYLESGSKLYQEQNIESIQVILFTDTLKANKVTLECKII